MLFKVNILENIEGSVGKAVQKDLSQLLCLFCCTALQLLYTGEAKPSTSKMLFEKTLPIHHTLFRSTALGLTPCAQVHSGIYYIYMYIYIYAHNSIDSGNGADDGKSVSSTTDIALASGSDDETCASNVISCNGNI